MAFQSTPHPLPPTTIHSSKTISQSAAHDFLTAYLDRATTDPSLQPDSTLSGHGPVSANTGSAPNLIIHNLKRVQAGLAGEVLGRDLTFAGEGEGGGVFALQSRNMGDGEDWGGEGQGKGKGKKGGFAGSAGADDGWTDLRSYEVQQDVVDAGEGDGEGEGEGFEGQGMRMDVDGQQGEGEGEGEGRKISKEERKAAKKERRKAEQRARNMG
ncbi:hypothetical protein FQN55_007361 [Onygenales sp. PD_40]|nr:hypothetical protein FQN55_007361 [Onygenales sp. PD_40]